MKRSVGAIFGVTALSACGLSGIPAAQASDFGFELNGTYSVVSNGDWAKSNEVYKPEATTRDIWHMSSSCTDTNACTGTVTSVNEGWTAPLRFLADHWVVPRDIPNWAPCETGGAATGHQLFWFYGVDESGMNSRNTELLGGKNTTFTDSGSCGKNLGLTIELPVRMERIS